MSRLGRTNQKVVLSLLLLVFTNWVIGCGEAANEPTESSAPTQTAISATSLPPTPLSEPTALPTSKPLPGMKKEGLPKISDEQLQADVEILYSALAALHPGLYRHIDQATLDVAYAELQAAVSTDLTLPQAYLAISAFLGVIQDGHTYANFYSQPSIVVNQVISGKDKLPFQFRLIDSRMIITKSAIEVNAGPLDLGTEILSINGEPVGEIIDTILPYVKADGGNDAKRLYDLQIGNVDGVIWWFDVFYPLLYPSTKDPFPLSIEALDLEGNRFSFETEGISQSRRDKLIEDRYGEKLAGVDDLWGFEILNESTALLRMGDFAVWNSSLDWETLLQDGFRTIKAEGIEHLIIDIRMNEGGLDIVPFTVSTYLTADPPALGLPIAYLAYEQVPAELDPHLNSWEPGLKDLSGSVEPVGERTYRFIDEGDNDQAEAFGNNEFLFEGEIYLLVDGGNSSATFLWSESFRKNEIGTIVGQPTGGNRKGTTGGQFFQLILPNSQIEVDIPLIALYPDEPFESLPDQGLIPDIVVDITLEDLLAGRDAVLEVVLEEIGP